MFDPTLCQAIADRVAQGETLSSVCLELGIKPNTITYWRNTHADVGTMFDEARDAGYDVIADRIRGVARGSDGLSTGNVIRDKLVVETDLKLLAKWDPRRYGDAITLKGDRDNPLASNVQDMSEEQLRKIVHEARSLTSG